MLTENNFAAALKVMGFTEKSKGVYEKIFAGFNVSMSADLNTKKLFFPAQIEGRERNDTFSESLRENLVVFECVNRLLDKGYRPEHIELEKFWKIGHGLKGGRADIVVSNENGDTLFIVECKTFGEEFNKELANMKRDGGQLFSYWQQEEKSKWLILYASNFSDGKIIFKTESVSCGYEGYEDTGNRVKRFTVWKEKYEQEFCGDVIFHDETVAYEIGVKPIRRNALKDFSESEGTINRYEEILRNNNVTNKQNAFECLINLFISKLADEVQNADANQLMEFVYKVGTDTYETFLDRLQRLFRDGMQTFMRENIFYVPNDFVSRTICQYYGKERGGMESELNKTFLGLKFYGGNPFSFIAVYNEELFQKNTKVLKEVVQNFQHYKIIDSRDLQTLGDMFEQLLDKGFKQDEGQFFTPIPITKFIWDALPLDEIIFGDKHPRIPKIIDYACGAGHFLTQGFDAVKKCFARHDATPPIHWEDGKIFGVEKNDRLSRVSKVSLFMNGVNKGKIKFGDGLDNYPDENISPNSFDILVANPPYSMKSFKNNLSLKNNSFVTLEKIVDGKEIETLFVERISQLLASDGVAAVILPSSILNKNNASFISARESLLQNFYIRAIVQLGSKTFGATGTNTVILFLQRFSEPPRRFNLFADSVNAIFENYLPSDWEDNFIFSAYTKKIGVAPEIYHAFTARTKNYSDWRGDSYFGMYVTKFESSSEFKSKINQASFQKFDDDKKFEWLNQKFYDLAFAVEREKIHYFAMTYQQTTLIISAPTDNKAQEKFLGYSWSNRKGDEGIKDSRTGGYLFDPNDRAAPNTLAALIRNSFSGKKISLPSLENFYYYLSTSDMLDFSGVEFTKIIKTTTPRNVTVREGMKLFKLSSADFDLSIGNRVLSTEIVEGGKFPVYSANVFEEFGRIDKQNLNDFSKPSIIWGIDGDWMVNLIPAGEIFYPTDHCGVLRVNTDEIIAEYLAFALRVAGEHEKFSRSNRASIQRIKSLTLQIPPLDEQKKIVEEFRAIDEEISAQEKIIAACDDDVKEKFAEMFGGVAEKIEVGKCCDIQRGENLTREQAIEGNVPVVAGGISPSCYHNVANREANIITISASGNAGYVNFWRVPIFATDCNTLRAKENFSTEYIFFALKNIQEEIYKLRKGSLQPHVYAKDIAKISIPNPPLELQKKFASYVEESEAKKNSAQVRLEELKAARESLVEKYFR